MVNDQTVRRLIMRAFNLPDGAEFVGDEHYQYPTDIDWEDQTRWARVTESADVQASSGYER
jgi:hypothetical protein